MRFYTVNVEAYANASTCFSAHTTKMMQSRTLIQVTEHVNGESKYVFAL